MTIKHLGKAKPNSPLYTRGYTINLTSNVPKETPSAETKPPANTERKKKPGKK